MLTLTLSMGATEAPPLAFYAATPNALLAAITLQARHIQAGQAQNLAVILNKASGSVTIFNLVITYTDGARQEVVDSTIGNTATITWQTPSAARPGVATFQLSTTGCGCGDRTIAQPTTTLESSIDGWFVVK